MASFKLKFSDPTNTDYLVVRWVQFSNPTVEIGRQSYNTPIGDTALVVDNVQPVLHKVQFYGSVDGVALTNLRLEMTVDAGIIGSEFVVYAYMVDRGQSSSTFGQAWSDPSHGQDVIYDQRLMGLTGPITFEKRGVGNLLQPDEISIDTIVGEIHITNGDIFSTGDVFFLTAKMPVQVAPTATSGGGYNDVVDITSDTTLGSTHYNKVLYVTATGVYKTLTLPSFASLADFKCLVQNHKGTVNYLRVVCSPGNTFYFRGEQRQDLWLGKGEQFEFMLKGNVMYVLDYKGQYDRLGEIVMARMDGLQGLRLDGTQYNISDHPRLYYDFIQKLPPDQIVTEAQWASSQLVNVGISNEAVDKRTVYPYKGFFVVDNVAAPGKFRVPDARNMFFRALKLSGSNDSERLVDKAGGLQSQMLINHIHYVDWANNSGLSGSLYWMRGGFGGEQKTKGNYGGTETRPDNQGFIPFMLT